MVVRLLPPTEFDSVYLYRFVTLVVLAALVGMVLLALGDSPQRDVALLAACVFLVASRFAVEWLRLRECAPAILHGDTLVFLAATRHRIALQNIRTVTSRRSFVTVRRYRSWTEHVAFLEITLTNGRRLHTLAASAVFESPAGRDTVYGLQAAAMAAKTDSASTGARCAQGGPDTPGTWPTRQSRSRHHSP